MGFDVKADNIIFQPFKPFKRALFIFTDETCKPYDIHRHDRRQFAFHHVILIRA